MFWKYNKVNNRKFFKFWKSSLVAKWQDRIDNKNGFRLLEKIDFFLSCCINEDLVDDHVFLNNMFNQT